MAKKKSGPNKKISKDEFMIAIVKNDFVGMNVQKNIKINRGTFYRYLHDYNLVQFFEEGQRLKRLDLFNLAESGLLKKVKANDITAIKYALSTIGKEIYSEKQIIEQTIKEHEIIKPKPKKE